MGNQITIGGKTYNIPNGRSISVNDDGVWVDGKKIDLDALGDAKNGGGEVKIVWEGPAPENLEIRGFNVSLECGDVGGNIVCDGSVKCGNISGNASVGGSANCGNVGGSVKANGSVNCSNVEGDVKANGSVKASKVAGKIKALPDW